MAILIFLFLVTFELFSKVNKQNYNYDDLTKIDMWNITKDNKFPYDNEYDVIRNFISKMNKKLIKHTHKFTPWKGMDLGHIVEFRLCKCGKVEFRGNYAFWKREYIDRKKV